jgi:hypothetical protein
MGPNMARAALFWVRDEIETGGGVLRIGEWERSGVSG